MGGGYSAPEVDPIPEKQATKSLSAGATAAAQAQKEKQRKNRGLTAIPLWVERVKHGR